MEARKLSKPDPEPFQLSLRIRHPSMDPAEFSREFKIKAEYSYRAGDPRPPRSGIAAATARSESYWLGALEPVKWPVDTSFAGHPLLQIAAENLRAAQQPAAGPQQREACAQQRVAGPQQRVAGGAAAAEAAGRRSGGRCSCRLT